MTCWPAWTQNVISECRDRSGTASRRLAPDQGAAGGRPGLAAEAELQDAVRARQERHDSVRARLLPGDDALTQSQRAVPQRPEAEIAGARERGAGVLNAPAGRPGRDAQLDIE